MMCPHDKIAKAILDIHDDYERRAKPGSHKILYEKIDEVQVVFLEDLAKHYSCNQNRRLRFALVGAYDVSKLDELSSKWLGKDKMAEQRLLASNNTDTHHKALKKRF